MNNNKQIPIGTIYTNEGDVFKPNTSNNNLYMGNWRLLTDNYEAQRGTAIIKKISLDDDIKRTINIIFPKKFKNTPYVFTFCDNTDYRNTINNISTAGFRFQTTNYDEESDYILSWVAYGRLVNKYERIK